MARSRVLIIGATGYLGRHLVNASLAAGHPTYALIRPTHPSSHPNRQALIESFQRSNVRIVEGSIEDRLTLALTLRRVDVVISAVGTAQLLKQIQLVQAIHEVGTIKRFVPSEFGVDVDRITKVPALQTMFEGKVQIRRVIEAAGIPYTYISSNCLASSFLDGLLQPGHSSPPRDRVVIYGNGDVKGIFVDEADVAAFTIKTIEDPRTLNKSLYIRPPCNTLSQNEMVLMWEEKVCRTLERLPLTEAEMEIQVEEAPYPISALLALIYIVCFKGDTSNFEIGSNGLEACALYPDVKYTTVSDYLDRFL